MQRLKILLKILNFCINFVSVIVSTSIKFNLEENLFKLNAQTKKFESFVYPVVFLVII